MGICVCADGYDGDLLEFGLGGDDGGSLDFAAVDGAGFARLDFLCGGYGDADGELPRYLPARLDERVRARHGLVDAARDSELVVLDLRLDGSKAAGRLVVVAVEQRDLRAGGQALKVNIDGTVAPRLSDRAA